MSIHSTRRNSNVSYDPKDPPKPHGPGISLGELIGGAVQQAQKLVHDVEERERPKVEKVVNQAKDTFEKVALTRVAVEAPHFDVHGPSVHAHANGDGAGIDVKFPSFKVKNWLHVTFTPPEE